MLRDSSSMKMMMGRVKKTKIWDELELRWLTRTMMDLGITRTRWRAITSSNNNRCQHPNT